MMFRPREQKGKQLLKTHTLFSKEKFSRGPLQTLQETIERTEQLISQLISYMNFHVNQWFNAQVQVRYQRFGDGNIAGQ